MIFTYLVAAGVHSPTVGQHNVATLEGTAKNWILNGQAADMCLVSDKTNDAPMAYGSIFSMITITNARLQTA